MSNKNTHKISYSLEGLQDVISGIAQRIKLIRNFYKENQTEFSERSKINRPMLYKYEAGENITFENIINLSNNLKININWLLTGVGFSGIIGIGDEEETEEKILIESYEFAAGSAGNGLIIEDQGENIIYEIPIKFLSALNITQKKLSKLKIFKVIGDSMEPDLPGGSWAFVDISENILKSSGIYLIRQLDEHFIKKVNKLDSERLELISSNPKYSTRIINTRDGQIDIIGRLIFIIQEVY